MNRSDEEAMMIYRDCMGGLCFDLSLRKPFNESAMAKAHCRLDFVAYTLLEKSFSLLTRKREWSNREGLLGE